MNYKKIICNISILILCLFLICVVTVIVIDPFFHYHKPIKGLKAVASEKEYQCIGTIRNFDYDALILGSSVCENYNNRWFDEQFDVKSIKAVRSYGAIGDLCYFMREAYLEHDIKDVFLNIDPFALSEPNRLTFMETGCPMYLYDDNAFNDIRYVLNKEVLFDRIPCMISKSFIGDYDEGESYNWAKWKTFGEDEVFTHYTRKTQVVTMKDEHFYEEECRDNIEDIKSVIEAHPESEFYIFIPPYSVIWWDDIYRAGETDAYIYNMSILLNELVQYKNVRLYDFLDDEEIVTDLNNYMDMVHFTPQINERIVYMLLDDGNVINEDEIEELIENTKAFSQYCNALINEQYESRMHY